MAACKDCIHYEICMGELREELDGHEIEVDDGNGDRCKDFQDKSKVLHEKVCATCGMTIEGNYFKVGDNFLQVKYFDDEDTENVFCSKDCLCKSLSVLEIDENGEAFQL